MVILVEYGINLSFSNLSFTIKDMWPTAGIPANLNLDWDLSNNEIFIDLFHFVPGNAGNSC